LLVKDPLYREACGLSARAFRTYLGTF